MARPPVFSVEDKYRLVLSVIGGGMTIVEAARRGKVSEQSISRWKQQFLEGSSARRQRAHGRQVRVRLPGPGRKLQSPDELRRSWQRAPKPPKEPMSPG